MFLLCSSLPLCWLCRDHTHKEVFPYNWRCLSLVGVSSSTIISAVCWSVCTSPVFLLHSHKQSSSWADVHCSSPRQLFSLSCSGAQFSEQPWLTISQFSVCCLTSCEERLMPCMQRGCGMKGSSSATHHCISIEMLTEVTYLHLCLNEWRVFLCVG